MDLIESEQNNVPVEAEPRYVPATASLPIQKTEHGQTWVRLVASIFGAIVLIIIIVFLARWIYHKVHHAEQTTPAVSQPAPASSSANTQSGASPQSSGNSSAPSTSSNGTSTSTGTGTGTSTKSGTNSNIADTGPGNVVAIFVGSSLAAAGLHYIINVRRFARTNY